MTAFVLLKNAACGEAKDVKNQLKKSQNLAKYTAVEFYGDSGLDFGGKVAFALGEIRLSFKADEEKPDVNFGVTATSSRILKDFPVFIKCGNLSEGGIISKMNSPAISASASPFAVSVPSAKTISASLPGFTNFSKPVSIFCEAGYKKWRINTWFSPENEKLAFSLGGDLKISKNIVLSMASAFGFFPYNELNESTWFFSEPYYPQGRHFCSVVHISASLPTGKTCVLMGANQTPFGDVVSWLRTENKLTLGNLVFGGAFFFNKNKGTFAVWNGLNENSDDEILFSGANITSSGKVLQPLLQIKGNIQYKSMVKTKIFPIFFKAGLSAYLGKNLLEDEDTIKCGFGLQAIFPFTLIQVSATGSFLLCKNDDFHAYGSFDNGSLVLKNVWYLGLFSPYYSLSASANPSSDFLSVTNTFKFSVGLTSAFINAVKLSGSANYTITQKNAETGSQKLAAALTARFTYKKIKCTCKLALAIDL